MSNVVAKTSTRNVGIDRVANDRRGTDEYIDHASDFISKWPLGTYKQPKTLSVDDFDKWLESRGILTVPPEGTGKQSDQWLGHLQRRHHAAKKLVLASTNRAKMERSGVTPFSIKIGGGVVTVLAPHERIATGEIPGKIETVLKTRRRQLRYLMEGADWAVLPEHERMRAETLNEDINDFEYHVRGHVEHLARKFDRLAHTIQMAVEDGRIEPVNGGINRFLADPTDTVDDDVHFERLWENG